MLGVVTIAVIATVATVSYFSDTEESNDNTFRAGSIDIKVSNEAYYNGASMDDLSWAMGDIGPESQFINYEDIKPGDYGYNRIATTVFDNKAWGHIVLNKKADSDVTCTEPETQDVRDTSCSQDPPLVANGELDYELFFIAWVDDNDNGVKEAGENLLLVNNSRDNSGWSNNAPFNPLVSPDGVMDPEEEYAIALGWCVGLPDGVTPGKYGNENMGLLAGAEVDISTCDGSAIGNRAQSDELVVDVILQVEQYRHNDVPSWN